MSGTIMPKPAQGWPLIRDRRLTGTFVPACAGITGLVAVTVAADVWAAKTRRPTISAAVASLLDHQVGGPVVVGVMAALGWHLACDPIIRQLSGGQDGISARRCP